MNLPNKLTILRICAIPLILLVAIFPYAQAGINVGYIHIGHMSISYVNIAVLLLFAAASFTDFLDGYIARKYKMITTFGKFADPIADKLLVTTMFVLFVSQGIIPVIPVIIMIARDTVVDGCRMIAATNGVVVAAGYLGKLKTVCQMVTIIFVLMNNFPFELYSLPFTVAMLWFTTLISLASGLSYFNQLKEYIFESK